LRYRPPDPANFPPSTLDGSKRPSAKSYVAVIAEWTRSGVDPSWANQEFGPAGKLRRAIPRIANALKARSMSIRTRAGYLKTTNKLLKNIIILKLTTRQSRARSRRR
jgi:hypothetical protein